MSNQPRREIQPPETVTPQEVRQFLLADLEAYKQAITELNDEELEEITGGGPQFEGIKAMYTYYKKDQGANIFTSIKKAVTKGPAVGLYRNSMGFVDSKDMLYAIRRDRQ
jgi:bacteriocin-like protein